MPKRLNIIYSGISVTCGGTIMVSSTMANSRFLPRNRKRAKPYAMIQQEAVCSKELTPPMSRVVTREDG